MANTGHTTSAVDGNFQTTHWSLVLAASQPDSPKSQEALARLCELYWYPVYAFIRRRGYDVDEAKDLTQELFARLIEKHYLEAADREKGQFRSFLLACVQHLLSNERRREQRLKRGGACSFISLDEALAEDRYGAEPADVMSPEKLFERRWAMTLLERTLELLKQDYSRVGKGVQFETLHVFLSGSRDAAGSYAEAGARLGMSDDALRQAVHRMRSRFGELFRAQVAQTVASPAELEAELKHLSAVLGE